LLVVGPVGTIVLAGAVIYAWPTMARNLAATSAAESEPRLHAGGYYDPDELPAYFVGRSEAEALSFFGTPSRVEAAGQITVWAFLCPVRNPATGKADTIVIVLCDRHKVAQITCGDADPSKQPARPGAAIPGPPPDPAAPVGAAAFGPRPGPPGPPAPIGAANPDPRPGPAAPGAAGKPGPRSGHFGR
jgi:hypothetical protein